MVKEWDELKLNELHILEEITIQGSKIAHLYRSKLSCFNFLILKNFIYKFILIILHLTSILSRYFIVFFDIVFTCSYVLSYSGYD